MSLGESRHFHTEFQQSPWAPVVALILREQKLLEEGCNPPALVHTHHNTFRMSLYLSHMAQLRSTGAHHPWLARPPPLGLALTSGPWGKVSDFCRAEGWGFSVTSVGRALTGRQGKGWRLEKLRFHKLARGEPRKPRSFLRGQYPPVPSTLGYPGQGLGLSGPGTPSYSLAPEFLSLPSLQVGITQGGVCCPFLLSALPQPGSTWVGPVLSLGRLYRLEEKGGAEAWGQGSPEVAVYSLSGVLGCCCASWALSEGLT